MFPFPSIAFRRMVYFNQQPKPTCSAVIVINGKIMLHYCLYISVPYIDTEARKIDSLFMQSSKSPIAVLNHLYVSSPFFFSPIVCQNQTVNHVTICALLRPAISRTRL